MLRKNFSDDAGRDISAYERSDRCVCQFRSDGYEKASGGLRIEKQSANFVGNFAGKGDTAFDEFAIVFHACGEEAGASCVDRARKIFDARVINFKRNAAADGHFARVPEKREARHVCDGVDRPSSLWRSIFDFVEGLGGLAIQVRHGRAGGGDPAFFGTALLQGCGDYAGTDWFREE